MPIIYKIDILAALKEKGFNTNRLRKEKLLAEGVIQSLREGKAISLQNLARICSLLQCQPGDIMAYKDDGYVHLMPTLEGAKKLGEIENRRNMPEK